MLNSNLNFTRVERKKFTSKNQKGGDEGGRNDRACIATHLTAEFAKTIPAQLAHQALGLPEVCVLQGGVPIKIEGEVVGGVGVSGGSGEQDIAISLAAAASIP
jgi:uncharacterized protein GlcG (DUF336 family)